MDEPAPEVVIADAQRPAAARLGYDGKLGCLWVALESPPQVRVTGGVYAGFARELAAFFRDLARDPPAGAPRRVASSDEELCVEAWADPAGVFCLWVSLAEDMWDPEWVVRVNLSVGPAELARVAGSIERLSRYADGLPPGPDAEPGAAPDRGGRR